MNWPNNIQLKFTSKKEKSTTKKVLFHVRIMSSKKNDYSMGPFVSNKSGKFMIEKNEIKKSIRESKNKFPMDYASNLEECTGIEIQVDSIKTINSRLEKIERFYPEKASDLRRKMKRNIENNRVKDTKKKVSASELSEVVIVSLEVE